MPVPQRTSFTNLSQLINANQQNRLGSTIQSGVQKDVSGLKQDVNQSSQQFGQDVQGANQNTQANQGFVSNAINNIINPAPPANANAPQGQIAPTIQDTGNTIRGTTPTQPGMVQAMETAPTVSQVKAQTADTTNSAQQSAPAAPKAPSTSQASNLNALPGSFGYASNATSGANQTQMANAPSAGDISKFAQLMGGTYTGPKQLSNLGTLQAKGANIQDIGQNALRQGGLQNLLQQYIGGGNQYNRGEQGLDTAILGQTGKPQLQNILNMTRDASMLPGQAEANAENLAAQTATGNQNFGRNILAQLSQAESPILQQVQQQIQSQEAQNKTMQDAANKIYGYLNDPLSPAVTHNSSNKIGTPGNSEAQPSTNQAAAADALRQAVQSGMFTDQQAAQIQDVMSKKQGDLRTILQNSFNKYQAPDAYTIQQGANAEQAAKLNALSQLAGLGNQFSTYGGMNPGTAGFDSGKIATQINNAALTPYWNTYYGGKASWNPIGINMPTLSLPFTNPYSLPSLNAGPVQITPGITNPVGVTTPFSEQNSDLSNAK